MRTAAARKAETIELTLPPQAPRPSEGDIVALADDDVAWAASPARALHDRLVESFAAADRPRGPAKALSPQARFAILIGSSLTLWAAIGGVAYLIA